MLDTARRQGFGWLIGFLGLTFGAAALGGHFTNRSVNTWYRTLRKPPWNPPAWVFGPVWTALYTLMAVAAWLVRGEVATDARKAAAGKLALAAWLVQLWLNVGWSWTFFGRRQIGGGVAVIAALWAWIAATAVLALRVSRPAGVLLLPYLAWTSFAAAINYRVWQLNREQ